MTDGGVSRGDEGYGRRCKGTEAVGAGQHQYKTKDTHVSGQLLSPGRAAIASLGEGKNGTMPG